MVGHQLLISRAYYNLALQLYFNGSTTCYLKGVMMVPKIFYSESRGCTCTPGTCLRAPMVSPCTLRMHTAIL